MFLNKHLKFRKSRLKGIASNFGGVNPSSLFTYGIKAKETGYLTLAQLEAARKAIQKMVRRHKRLKFVKICVSSTISRSRKKKGIRMGASKGPFYGFVYRARPGNLLFEIRGLNFYQLRRRLAYILAKLPIQVDLMITRIL